jgi:hypothetical protein
VSDPTDERRDRPEDPEEQRRLEEERVRREAEELASFERRAEWARAHYGGAAEGEVDERTREAVEHAERLAGETGDGDDAEDEGP